MKLSFLIHHYVHLKDSIRRTVLPLLYPRRCPFCQRILPYSSYICNSCQSQLPMIHSPICYRCGKPLTNEENEFCYDCRTFPKSFDQGLSLFRYTSMTQIAMMNFKYHNKRYLSDFFVHAICLLHTQEIKAWHLQAIIPIPIHKNKKRRRGYNQAELLASQLGLRMKVPSYPDFILRQIDTLPQKEFSPQSRLTNLNKAFQLNPKYLDASGRHLNKLYEHIHSVLLMDDIYTTGATMESCTRILKSIGIKHVYIYSICIGVSRDEI